jgi:hypothetical protein
MDKDTGTKDKSPNHCHIGPPVMLQMPWTSSSTMSKQSSKASTTSPSTNLDSSKVYTFAKENRIKRYAWHDQLA